MLDIHICSIDGRFILLMVNNARQQKELIPLVIAHGIYVLRDDICVELGLLSICKFNFVCPRV